MGLGWMIATALLGVVVLFLIPYLAVTGTLALAPQRLFVGFVADEPARWERSAEAVAQLEALGFTRLGVRAEGLGPFRTRSCELASADERCFASVHGRRVLFLSAFADGAVALTATRAAFKPERQPDFVYQGVEGSLEVVLASHRATVRELSAQGRVPAPDFGPGGREAAARAYYAHPAVRRRQRRELTVLVLQVAFAAALAAWVAFGPAPRPVR